MKLRSDFVTNSSSGCFVLRLKNRAKTLAWGSLKSDYGDWFDTLWDMWGTGELELNSQDEIVKYWHKTPGVTMEYMMRHGDEESYDVESVLSYVLRDLRLNYEEFWKVMEENTPKAEKKKKLIEIFENKLTKSSYYELISTAECKEEFHDMTVIVHHGEQIGIRVDMEWDADDDEEDDEDDDDDCD